MTSRYPAASSWSSPAVSAGVNDAATYDQDRIGQALGHIRGLHDAGRAVLLQPYCHRVDTDAETEVVFIAGEISHCMRKGPLLSLDCPIEQGPWREEDMSARAPEPDMIRLARRVHDVVAARFGVPLYARVDALRDTAGQPVLLELELVEPSLFLQYERGSAERLAAAIVERMSRCTCLRHGRWSRARLNWTGSAPPPGRSPPVTWPSTRKVSPRRLTCRVTACPVP